MLIHTSHNRNNLANNLSYQLSACQVITSNKRECSSQEYRLANLLYPILALFEGEKSGKLRSSFMGYSSKKVY